MKIKGFTLSEVLIALAIVGVLAAVTLPSLKANIQKKSIGPAFLKGIETLEIANRQLLQEESATSVHDHCDTTKYFECIEKYVEVSDSMDISSYKKYNLTDNIDLTGYKGYMTKDGIIFITKGTHQTIISSTKEPYKGTGYEIYIDVNGDKKPNAAGYDLFLVYVDDIGSVIPYGGRLYKKYAKGTKVLWEDTATECKPDKEPAGDGLSCSGSIVDNGGQVLYK